MQLLTSGEFAKWFGALDEARAEDVAATLEVIAQLGTEKEAPGSTEWVTWYEHPTVSSVWQGDGSSTDPAVLRFVEGWGAFNGYARRVIKHLESRPFVARLNRLDRGSAAAVTDAVARIKRAVTRRQLDVSDYHCKRKLPWRLPTTAEVAGLAQFLDVQEIRDAYLAALAASGFTVIDVPAHSPALREILLRTPAPGFRLLYGVDARHDRGLVVLGEPLDRSFYGDSVRHAERLWQEFLNGDLQTVQPGK